MKEGKKKQDFFLKECSETVAFLDVQVNHITKNVGHINNKVFQKSLKDSGFGRNSAFFSDFFAEITDFADFKR